ncbi:unnamed protein product [Brassica oleracea var. botrytis]|uniref:(rape) hypothetical protein n=1 Tax=Brassica napus TaxID=3708 RepID=A0A816LGF7_BRANA|nr:unnamed protein product [Brassica napus]
MGTNIRVRPKKTGSYSEKRRSSEKNRNPKLLVMKLAKSFVAHYSYRRGKPFGRHSFSNGSYLFLSSDVSNGKPVVRSGSDAAGLAMLFGFTGYMIWQIVENIRITKAAEKAIENHTEARLRNTRVYEGYEEVSSDSLILVTLALVCAQHTF